MLKLSLSEYYIQIQIQMWKVGVENRIGDQIKDQCHLDNSITVDEQLF